MQCPALDAGDVTDEARLPQGSPIMLQSTSNVHMLQTAVCGKISTKASQQEACQGHHAGVPCQWLPPFQDALSEWHATHTLSPCKQAVQPQPLPSFLKQAWEVCNKLHF